MTRQIVCAVLMLSGPAAAFTGIAPPPPAVPAEAERTPAGQERQPALADRRMIEIEKAQLAGKLVAAVEMRTTPGAPYSAEAATEFVQSLADGNRIARRSVMRIVRDSEGRVRREHVAADGRVESITISDPVAGTSVVLDPESRTAHGGTRPRTIALPRSESPSADLREAERKKAAELEVRRRSEAAMPPPPPLAPPPGARPRVARADGGAEQVTRQDLGQRVIEGVNVRGTRTTTVIPAGAIGNDQPIRIVSEEWFSPDLQVLVLTRHNDPRSGETVYALSNIVRAEPDRALFEVPADYTRK